MGIAFLLTTLVVVVTPGTGALYTIAAGITRGARTSLVAAAGCTLGIVPHLIAALTGLAALLNASAVAFDTLRIGGVVYLLYLAWATFRDRSTLRVDETAAPASAGRVVLRAVLLNLLNPKLTIFFFAFLPQFVAPGEPDASLHLLGLSGVFMAATLVVFSGYGLFAAAMRRRVIERPKVVLWLRRTFAASYLLLAGRLALSGR